MVDKIRRMKLKICMVGERAVGKTSLLNRYVYNEFDEAYHGTLGSRMCLLTFKQVVAAEQLVEAEIALFDLMGERALRDAFRDVLFWGTHGFLAVADVTKAPTIRALPVWIRTVRAVAGEVPFRILINKADMAPQGAISPGDTAWLLSEFPSVPYHLTSAKNGAGVKKAFDSLIDDIVDGALSRSRNRRETKIVGNKILAFAKRRAPMGVSKRDLLMVFKDVDHNTLMREVEDLQQLGFVVLELMGPGSFVVKITAKGERELECVSGEERIVEEPT